MPTDPKTLDALARALHEVGGDPLCFGITWDALNEGLREGHRIAAHRVLDRARLTLVPIATLDALRAIRAEMQTKCGWLGDTVKISGERAWAFPERLFDRLDAALASLPAEQPATPETGGLASAAHWMRDLPLSVHGYTCGWCEWGRADQPRSYAEYEAHVAETGHKGTRPAPEDTETEGEAQ